MFGGDSTSKIVYVAKKIAALEGVEAIRVAPNDLIEVTVKGPNKNLREDILNLCQRAMMAVAVKYKLEDGRLVTHKELQEATVTLPLVSFAQSAIAALGVQGPTGSSENQYKTVFVPGGELDKPESPADEIAKPDGAEKLKRLRAKTRGRPVVGWKINDQVVKKGSVLKITNACALQWTFGRVVNLNAGSIANVIDVSSRRPIAYVTSGDFDAIEFPIHLIGKAAEIVTEPNTAASCEPGDMNNAKTLQNTAPDLYRLFGLRDIPQDDYSKIESLNKKK